MNEREHVVAESAPEGKLKLNLGCGRRKLPGFVNVDSQAGCQPDVLLDLEKTPWPWPDDSVAEVELIHVLEHIGQAPAVYLAVMKELWRVCCDGARVHVVVPHPRSDDFLNDPTHVRPVTEAGLELFCQRLNAEWEEAGAANTPLGFYLGIDFEIEAASVSLKPHWKEKYESGEISEAELRLAGMSQFNVFSQLSMLLRAVKPAGQLIQRRTSEDAAPVAAAAPEPDAAWHADIAAALDSGEPARVMAALESVLAVQPGDREARTYLASMQHANGQLQAAYDNYRQLTAAADAGFELFNNLGVVALEMGLARESVNCFQAALDRQPENRMVRANLAEALGADGRVRESVDIYESLVREAPQEADTYLGMAKLFISQGWFGDALKALDMAQAFGMEDADADNQRGIVLREMGQDEAALAAFERGLEKMPGNVPLMVNRANALARLGRDDEAEAIYRAALAAVQGEIPEELGFSLACFLLKRGRTEEGWEHYEIRRRSRGVRHHPLEARLPQWRGEEVGPRDRLLVLAEQGYGDNIQFSRLLQRLAGRFAQVTLEARPAVAKLFARSFAGICEVVENVPEDVGFDWYCPIASLPFALGLPVDEWGMEAPYLKADSMQSALWGFRIPATPLPKVGLCCAGGKAPRYRHRCDLPLELADGLLEEQGVRWISLQKAGSEEWRRQRAQAGRLLDVMDMVNNFDDTAALVANLDLVITVDTSVAHLAGALGKPVWLLLEHDGDWRWLDKREDSPWYPGMRIFRQPAPGNWQAVGEQVRAALKNQA